MENFSQLYKIIYDKFSGQTTDQGRASSKLALARLLGISQGKAQNWEKGAWPNARDCWTIHKKLGFNLEWLLTGEGEMLAEPKPDRPDRAEAETLRQEIAYLKELILNKDEIIMLQRRLIADKPPTWE